MKAAFVDWLLQHQDFQQCYSEKRFWRGQYPQQDLADLFSWDDLNDCLSTNRITNDRLRLSTAQQYEHYNRRVFRPTRDAFGRATDHLLIHELQVLMRDGVTAVLEAVNELTSPVGETTERLACELGVRSAANAYVSFGLTSGFGIHHDDHDVLVIQIDGRKMWQFFSSPDGQEKARVEDLHSPSERDRGDSIISQTGDVMYIPKRTWHDVTAMNEKSLHLTISLVNPTLLDFVQWSLKKQNEQFSAQDIRRNASSIEHQLAFCRHAVTSLFTDRNLETFLQNYHASYATVPVKATFPTLHSAHIEDTFRRIVSELVVTEACSDDGSVPVFALGRVHRLTQDEYTLLLALPCGAGKPGSALLSEGRNWADIAPLLTSLMDRGLAGKRLNATEASTTA